MFQGSRNNTRQQDPDPEVVARAKRRQFSEADKKRILEEYYACTEPGEKGALLRREGIYSSYITTWKRQIERGTLAGSDAKKRGPKEEGSQEELEKLRQENDIHCQKTHLPFLEVLDQLNLVRDILSCLKP